MSIEAMTWALNATVGSATTKLVLVGYANHAHKDGRNAWPTHETIAEYVECSTRTVLRHVKDLVAEGFLAVGDQRQVAHLRADRRPVVYDLAMSESVRLSWRSNQCQDDASPTAGRGDDLSPRDEETTRQIVTPSDDHGVTHGVTPMTSRGDTAVSHEPSGTKEPSPLPPTSGGTRLHLTCQRHGTDRAPNCRGCGTTDRQIKAQQARDAADRRRLADQEAAARSKAARATAAPVPVDLVGATRDAIEAARLARQAGGTR